MTIRRSLTGVTVLALVGSLVGGGAWALQNAPQQPPAAQTPPSAPAPIIVPQQSSARAQSRPVPAQPAVHGCSGAVPTTAATSQPAPAPNPRR
jgi:hypothetical protein